MVNEAKNTPLGNETKNTPSHNATPSSSLKRNRRYIILATICIIASALAACAIDAIHLNAAIQDGTFVALQPADESLQTLIADNARTLILVSILTAIVEEVVFRGLLLRALLKRLSQRATILITSGAFAALHMIPLGIDAIPSDPTLALIALSVLLKGAQAFVFGMVMAKIILHDSSLPIVIALHALFDTIYFAAPVLSTGAFPTTYIATSPDQFLTLVVSTLLLLPAALKTRSAGLNA